MRRTTVRLLVLTLLSGAILPVVTATSALAGGSCHEAATDRLGVSVDAKDLCFWPTVLSVKPGQEITWTNHDPFVHTVTGLGYEWGSGGDLKPGQSFSASFDKPGVYPYACAIHPGMVGAVVVAGKVTSSGVGPFIPAVPPVTAPPVVVPQAVRAVVRTGHAIWPFGLALAVVLLLGGGLLFRSRWSDRQLRQPVT